MFIKRYKQRGKTYLMIVEPYRENGKNKAKTIKSLGYLEDLQQNHPDIDNYLNLILEETKKEYYQTIENDEITITIKRKDAESKKNLGYALAKKIYSELGIKEFLANHTRHKDLPYNLNQVFLLLVMNRFVLPGSKRNAYRHRDLFFERFNFTEQQMYQSLTVLSELSDKLQGHLYEKTQQLVEIDKKICKYDVTNFFFYSQPDENTTDEDGNITEYGIRRYGPSKEGVYRPITQYGLLCDKKGIPMSYKIFSGGKSEKTTFLSIIDNTQKKLAIPKIIVIADRGINTATNMYGLSGDNGAYQGSRRSKDENICQTKEKNGFIFGETIRGKSQELIDWVLDPKDYVKSQMSDGTLVRYKSRVVIKTIRVKTKEGKRSQRKIKVKELAYYNSKYDRRSKHEREDLLRKAEELKKDVGRYNQKSKRGNGRYIKDNHYALVNGKKIRATVQELDIDYLKALEDELLDGYYCLETSELEMPDEEIWANYHELHDIENCFRVSKSEFNLQPVFVRRQDSINAHVLICFVALLIFRILLNLCDYAYSSDQIFAAIRELTLTYAGEGYFLSDKQKTDIVKKIGEILGLEFKEHYMNRKEIMELLKY